MGHEKGLLSYETLVHAIAGATGSVVGMSAFYPLDTIRCRLQLEETERVNALAKNGSVPSTSNGIYHSRSKKGKSNGCDNGSEDTNGTNNNGHEYSPLREPHVQLTGISTLEALQRVLAAEGVSGLYRGVVPVLQSLCCSNFVYFYTFHGLRGAVGKSQSAGKDLMLGAAAGAVNVLLTTPLWVVNTRLKVSGTPYKSLWAGLAHVLREEGPRGLWAGTLPSLLLVANPAIQFMAYEALKRRLLEARSAPPAPLVGLALGAMAKAMATILTYPLQVVQARLRHGSRGAPMSGGVRSMFRGLEAKLLQTVLTAALMFAAYERIVRFVLSLLHRNRRMLLK